jgi:CCDC81-like prokaryotic HU domain 1/CCDC81-like prokaryotic HU domain 2
VKLDQYISELLFEHECVIIPGFGGIVANHRPSFLNPAHHTFSPPSKRLAFNANLRTNDGLLASHLSKRLSVNYNEANSYISSFVHDCTKSLQDGQKLVLDKVGVLYMDGEKHLQFMPDASVNYLKSSFGFTSFHSPAIRRDEAGSSASSNKKDKKGKIVKIGRWRVMEVIPVAAMLAYLIINPAVVTTLNEQVASLNPFPKPVVIQYNKKLAAVEAAKNAVLNDESVFALKSSDTVNSIDSVKPEESVVETSSNEFKEEAPVINLKPNTITQEEVAADNDINAKESNVASIDKTAVKKEVVSNETTSAKRYYIIGGCFSIEENATKFLEECLAKGYAAEIIGKNNKGMTMVSLFSSSKSADAEQELASIKLKEPAGGWVLRK